MQTPTVFSLLVITIVVLAVVVALMLWHAYCQERDIRQKNDVIVREVRRNQKLIDYGVSQGLSRSAMLDCASLNEK